MPTERVWSLVLLSHFEEESGFHHSVAVLPWRNFFIIFIFPITVLTRFRTISHHEQRNFINGNGDYGNGMVESLTSYWLSWQHGFRRGRSCVTNLLAFLDNVTSYNDDRESVDIIFLDFAKAFDKVPHRRLMSKLKAHGIDGRVQTGSATGLITGCRESV